MAERTESSITIEAAPADVMAVIADFAAYPEWTGAVKEADVRSSASNGRAKEVWFKLEDANILKTMDGAYLLADNGDGTTTVTYQLVVDVKMPLLGMMKRKAEKVIIDTALKELKKRVEG